MHGGECLRVVSSGRKNIWRAGFCLLGHSSRLWIGYRSQVTDRVAGSDWRRCAVVYAMAYVSQ